MIPAILSCVFVIYLYQTLNPSPSSENVSGKNTWGSALDADALLKRMRLLQDRIEKLAADQRKSGGKP